MYFLRRIHSIWCGFIFILIFLALLPFFVVVIEVKPWNKYGFYLNKIWAKLLFPLWGFPLRKIVHFRPSPDQNYIYCPNHTSYLDIPLLGCTAPTNFVFMGKNSLSKIPLFGYVFSRLNVDVDRNSRFSGRKALGKAEKMLESGRSIVIFPEGTIPSAHVPRLHAFKKGAFKLAIEKNVPIVPVTIPYNWKLLPDDGRYLPKIGAVKIVFHDPITPAFVNFDEEALNRETFRIIEEELKKYPFYTYED